MMIEQATVVAYRKGWATVQCYAKAGCRSCVANGCGTKALSALAGEKQAPRFELAVGEELKAGDMIEIGLSETHLLQGVFWLYAVPLFVMIGTTLFFSRWIENELIVAMAMLISTLTTFGIIRRIMKRKPQGVFTPVFLRKI